MVPLTARLPALLCSLIAVAVLALGVAAPAGAQPAGVCVVTGVTGAAVVSARGAGRRVATPGLGLGTNATLRTGADARVAMTCPDGLRVVIGPDSTLAVSGVLAGGRAPFGLRLRDGIAGFLLRSGDPDDDTGGVQVRTPSAVAAVRSTDWAMRVQARASAVFVRDGAVVVAGGDGTVRLAPGEGVDVAASGAVGPVVRWGQPRIDRFDALLGPEW